MEKFRVKPIKDFGGYLVSENGKIYSFINGEIISYECISDSHKDGFRRQGICHCCNGKIKSHMGYKWYYAEAYFKNGDDK